jgi:hypothetical protein
VKLPFLQESKWPSAKEPEERVVNPSHDKQLQDHLVDELLSAAEHKDYGAVNQALVAIVQSIRNEDTDEM